MRVFKSDTCNRLTHIEEIVEWKSFSSLLDSTELAHLLKPFVHNCCICAEGYLVHFFFTQCAQTLGFQQRSYLVETYFRFKVLWINHDAKIVILLISCKKFV